MPRARGVSRAGKSSIEWAGVILTNREGHLLLNLRGPDKLIAPNRWDIIGGTIESDETPHACLLREVKEETGAELADAEWFRDYDFPLADGHSSRLHVYAALLDKPAAELLVGEGVEHRFFPAPGLEELDLAPGVDVVLQDYLSSDFYRPAGVVSSR